MIAIQWRAPAKRTKDRHISCPALMSEDALWNSTQRPLFTLYAHTALKRVSEPNQTISLLYLLTVALAEIWQNWLWNRKPVLKLLIENPKYVFIVSLIVAFNDELTLNSPTYLFCEYNRNGRENGKTSSEALPPSTVITDKLLIQSI